MSLNENIKNLRLSSGKSQVQMAQDLGVTKQCVSNWENDNVLPSIEMLIKLADYFSITTDGLLGIAPKSVLNVDGLSEEEQGHLRNVVNDIKKLRN